MNELGGRWIPWLISLLAVVVVAFYWHREVTDYKAHRGQLVDQPAVDDFLRDHPSPPDALEERILIPTGVFIQSLGFTSPSDVNITGYIWQKYDRSVPADLSRGVVLPERILSDQTVLEEAYRRPYATGEVIGSCDDTRKRYAIIQYKDNAIMKRAYWPLVLSMLAIITIISF